MTLSRQQAVRNALAATTNKVGMCAQWTRQQFGVPALGDFDGDGDADAVDMWKACVLKHHADSEPVPPAGVPVFWSGGSKGHGHAAVSLGGGMVRSTDAWTAGQIGTVPISEVTRRWGMPYLGWTEDLYGHEIPDPEGDLRRAREDKLAKARVRGAKWKRWLDRNRKFRARLRETLRGD
jgi:hypothetical protein